MWAISSATIEADHRMRGHTLIAAGLSIAALVSLAACGKPGQSKTTPTLRATTAAIAVSTPATNEKYRVLTPKDGLSCRFSQDLSTSMTGITTSTVTATTDHFDCVDKEGKQRSIDLVSTGLVGGKVQIITKNFGTVFRGNEEGTFDKYEMAESQIKKLKTFLGYKK